MEVVGLIASAAQISVYACSIVSLISEIRSAARNGPLILQERSQQLVLLGCAVEKIRLDTVLHTDVLSGYLLTIQHKIRTLHDLVRLRSQRPTNSSVQRLRTALAFVTRDKEVESSFASLQAHCQTLYFYMSSTGSHPYDGSRTASTCTPRGSRDDGRPSRRPLTFDESDKELVPQPRRVTDDTGKEFAPPGAHRTLQANAMPVPEPFVRPTPAGESSGRSQGQRFTGNTASDNSSQSFGNHTAGSADFKDQVFDQNAATKNSAQKFGNSVVPERRKAEHPGSEKDDRKQAGK